MDLKLAGRVLYVTGGSHGIGRATVDALLREGALVATCARDLPSQQEPLRLRLVLQGCDVRDASAMQGALSEVLGRFGRLDGVVANAGYGTSGRVLETAAGEWMAQFELKLFGV